MSQQAKRLSNSSQEHPDVRQLPPRSASAEKASCTPWKDQRLTV